MNSYIIDCLSLLLILVHNNRLVISTLFILGSNYLSLQQDYTNYKLLVGRYCIFDNQ